MKKTTLIIFLCFLSLNLLSQKDTIFWFATPSLSTVSSTQFDRPTFLKFSTFNQATTITISMPANATFNPISINIPANSHNSINMTPYIDQIESRPSNAVLNLGLLIKSSSIITAYYEAEGYSYANPDIFTLKGKNSLGKTFYIPFQNYSRNCDTDYGCEGSSFDIIATEDNTVVYIKPKNNIDGHNANIEFSVILNKGQVYSAKASGRLAIDHLGGSKVTSNKPIAITIKDDLTNNFADGFCQDLIGDQMIPVEKLGSDFILVKGDLNVNDRFYVCATQPNTTISVDNVLVSTINEGQMYSGSFSGNTAYITTSSPVCILHITGYGCEVGGAIIPPLACTGSKEIVLSRTTDENFSLMLIVKSVGINNFTLNNNASLIPSTAFSPVNGTSNVWSYAKISYSSASLPANSFIRVKNSTSNFHLAVINGQASVTGCRYGFFSEFNKSQLDWVTTNHSPTNQFCIGDTIRLYSDSIDGDNTTTYLWAGPNGFSATIQNPYFIATGTQINGTYTVNANTSACAVEPLSINILVSSPSIVLPADTTICSNSPITLTPTGVFTSLLWSTGTTTPSITVNSSGTYWVKGFLGSNCFATDTIHINLMQSVQFSLGNDTTLCDTTHLVLNAPSGSYSYLWSTGNTSNSIDINQSGTYWLQIENNNICPYRDSIIVSFVPIPTPNLGADTILCFGSSLILTDGLYTGTSIWSTGFTGHSITINTAGSYWVTSSSTNNCSNSDTIYITSIQSTPINLGIDTMLCDNQFLELNAGYGFNSYLWSTGSIDSHISVLQPGTYWVQATDGPCTSSDDINILPCPCTVWAPNTFTPNSDNINDNYYIVANNLSYLNIQIFNRWGELLYEQTDLNAKWNGKYKGQICPEGVYFCVIKYKCDYTKDKLFQTSTSVTLIQ